MNNLGEQIFNLMLSKDHTDHQFAFGLSKSNIQLLCLEDLAVFYLISLYNFVNCISEEVKYINLLEEIIPKNNKLDNDWSLSDGKRWDDIPHNYYEAIMFINKYYPHKLEILKNLMYGSK